MPLTLDKLFSKTLPVEIEFAGEVVHAQWAPARYTGEMEELAEALMEEDQAAEDEIAALDREMAELVETGNMEAAVAKREAGRLIGQKRDRRDQREIRRILSTLLVSWDILDGDKPLPTDATTLKKLPSALLTQLFLAIGQENTPDPQKAPSSPDSSEPTESLAQSQPGTSSSEVAITSVSPPGTSTNGHKPSATTRSGAAGPS